MSRTFSWTFDRLYKLDSSKVSSSSKAQKHSGRGVFEWPNGASYKGEFLDNRRHGEGVQKWADGSSYKGRFHHDIREGFGRHAWSNGEVYEGLFLEDKRHGKGKYCWPNGTRYEGHFCNDLKEGYGRFYFPDGKRFEGVYKSNERNGAGILTYRDGQRDVGIWLGEKLIRICTVMENTFLFQHFCDYFVNAGENVPSKVKRANSALINARTINEDRCAGPEHFFENEDNNSLSLDLQVPETFPLADILDGVRSGSHGIKGPCELASEELLHIAGKGDCIRLKELLEHGLVHVDVADKTGFTALLAASVNCHKDVVNCLLDYGADVNKLNYEGLSALAACHVLFYTKHTWKENIGEALGSENLLNSVYWSAESGTFLQRIPVYVQKKTRPKVKVVEAIAEFDKISGLNSNITTDGFIEGVNQNSSISDTSAPLSQYSVLEAQENDKNGSKPSPIISQKEVGCGQVSIKNPRMNDVNSSTKSQTESVLSDSQPVFVNDNSKEAKVRKLCLDKNYGDGRVRTNIRKENCTLNQEDSLEDQSSVSKLEPSKITGRAHSETGLSIPNENIGIKQSVVQRTEVMDKNTFIHVFLNRAASARSKQNSSCISYENLDSSLEKSSLDNKNDGLDYQNESSVIFTEENNKDFEKRKDVIVAVSAVPDAEESTQYSIQNAKSSSLHTTETLGDFDTQTIAKLNRQKMLTQQRRPHLEATVQLLLRRGANPNASSLPMPVLFFAVKAADTAAVKLLLEKGADTNARLSTKKLGITPLHIAVALPTNAVSITKLLLKAGADPNLRDFAFGEFDEGRTPLHTACCREDNDEVSCMVYDSYDRMEIYGNKNANHVINFLLDYDADPNLLCNGHSALSLAIGSGNDLAVESLLKRNADPNFPLTHGVGSPLCAAVSFTAGKRRKHVDCIRLVNKLIRSGANILAPIIIGREHPPGTVVDYAYNVFYQDRRIAHTAYHALTPYEREIYVTRRKMLDHLAELLRTHVLKKEKKLLEEQLAHAKALKEESHGASGKIGDENIDRAVSFCFDELQTEVSFSRLDSSLEKASLYDEAMSCYSSNESRFPDCGLRVAIVQTPYDQLIAPRLSTANQKRKLIRKSRFRYCYECGRSVAVRLAACTRCKQVFYCSRNCKLKAWNSRHKEECKRLSVRKAGIVSRGSSASTSSMDKDNSSVSVRRANDDAIK